MVMSMKALLTLNFGEIVEIPPPMGVDEPHQPLIIIYIITLTVR